MRSHTTTHSRPVQVRAGSALIEGDLTIPERALGLVVFAHGSGSSRFSRRNRAVAQALEDGGFATLLLDLLTREEEAIDLRTCEYRFDIDRLGDRVVAAIDWASGEHEVAALPIACFGASTGAAAALIAAAERPNAVRAVISRGGRPDLADHALPHVQAPTLFIVGGADDAVIKLNQQAMWRMRALVSLEIVRGATHLFEEHGTLEEVSRLALAWCRRHLRETAPARIRDVPPSEWCLFFERFSRAHRAWLATVHGIVADVPITRVPSVAIESVAFEKRASEHIVRLTFANGISLCVPRPCAVRVQEADDGAEWALEVDTADGAFIRLAFRATALPEQLDGLAPGEVNVEMPVAP
jgi:dienelactone hydrolase